MELITAEAAFDRLNEKRGKQLLSKFNELVEDAIIRDETSISVKGLSQSVKEVLEKNGYRVYWSDDIESYCISWDLSKPEFSIKLAELGSLDAMVVRRYIEIPELNLKTNFHVNEAPGGVYILTSERRCVRPDAWDSYKSDIPVGIAIIEGGINRIVALHGSGGDLYFSNDSVTPAAKFCKEYEAPTMPKGSWRLPDLAELIFLHNRKNIIDAALTICGGKPLHYGWHWASTEDSSEYAWGIQWCEGAPAIFSKNRTCRVRPISVLQ